jgi:hypothetical protein
MIGFVPFLSQHKGSDDMNNDELMLYTLPGFCDLPRFPPALPDTEIRMLATLPEWPATQEVWDKDRSALMSLFRRGLVKVTHDSAGMWAGKTQSSVVRQVK